PDDATHVTESDAALRHAQAASRLLMLALEGLLSDNESVLVGDCPILVDLVGHVWTWTQKGRELRAAERAAALPTQGQMVDPDNVVDLMDALKQSLERQRGEPA